MKYFLEFVSHRLIIFLTFVLFFSAAATGATPGRRLTWAAILAGILLFLVAEYLVHRFLLHEFPKLMPHAYRGHVDHHQHPLESKYLFGPLRYDLINYIGLYLIVLAITRSFHLTAAVALGTSLCQWYYQWKHFVSHRPIVPITPWGRYVKKKHLLHHYKDAEAWYGVSNPVFDFIAGTDAVRDGKHTVYYASEQHTSEKESL